MELSNRQDNNVTTGEIITASIKKYRRQYTLILALIAIFECYFAIRGLISFDFSSSRRVLYMVAYCLLLVYSVFGVVLLLRSKAKNTVSTFLKWTVYFYCIFIVFWSANISVLDILGGHPPIVYMTVVMGVAALAFIRPMVFIIVSSSLSGVVLHFCKIYGDGKIAGDGFILNFLVFVIITFFIAFRKFNQNKQDYLITRKLEMLSYLDQLTGVKNRVAFHEEIETMGNMYYFGILDFDDFKHVNDEYGHDLGDETLKVASGLFVEYFGNHVYRFGGDEFVVLSTAREKEIVENGEKINAILAERFPGKNISVSGGFYFPTSSTETFKDYLRNADKALYETKRNGKAKFVVLNEKEG